MTEASKDEVYMAMAKELAKLSNDEGRKTSCLFVGRNGCILASGVNGFMKCLERTPERLERPAKYAYTEHAERNAIYASRGADLRDSTAYIPWFPCADCARALVLVGVWHLVCHEPDWNDTRYSFKASKDILLEHGVRIIYLPDIKE